MVLWVAVDELWLRSAAEFRLGDLGRGAVTKELKRARPQVNADAAPEREQAQAGRPAGQVFACA